MVRVALQCALWGCLLTAVHLEPSTACGEKQFSSNGQCCDLCQPGKRMQSECTEYAKTQCLPCGPGEFLGSWSKETHCHQHRYCDPHQGLQVWKEGTSETDSTCACQEGQHCVGKDCDSCALHTECGPGFGVTQMATGKNDTVCEPCPAGFFSNVSSSIEKCHSWTSCEANNLVVLQAGTRQTDTVCGGHPRMRSLLVIPIVMGVFITILLVSVSIKKMTKKPKDKAFLPETEPQDPREVEDVPGPNPATPVQETLHGCQPVTQEDGKESRISVQERQ